MQLNQHVLLVERPRPAHHTSRAHQKQSTLQAVISACSSRLRVCRHLAAAVWLELAAQSSHGGSHVCSGSYSSRYVIPYIGNLMSCHISCIMSCHVIFGKLLLLQSVHGALACISVVVPPDVPIFAVVNARNKLAIAVCFARRRSVVHTRHQLLHKITSAKKFLKDLVTNIINLAGLRIWFKSGAPTASDAAAPVGPPEDTSTLNSEQAGKRRTPLAQFKPCWNFHAPSPCLLLLLLLLSAIHPRCCYSLATAVQVDVGILSTGC